MWKGKVFKIDMLDNQLNPDSKNTKWCLGIPCTGSRPLSFEETLFLNEQLSIIRALWISIVSASFVIPFFAFTLFYFMSEALPDFFGNFFAIIIIFMLFIGFPVLFLLAKDYFKKAKNLKKDIAAGFVYFFEGVPDEKDRFFKKLRIPIEKESKKLIFEVLPAGFIFSLNGKLVKTRGELEITEASSAPENPYVISLPKELLQGNTEQNKEWLRRRLTPLELNELKKHSKQLLKISKPTFAFMIFVPCFASLGAASSASLAEWFEEFKVGLIIGLSFWLCTIYFYIRRVLYSRKFSEDIDLGWVIIFRKQEEQGSENQQEILPVSSALWTDKGKPSKWRMMKTE